MHMCLMSTYPKSLCLPTLLQKGPISGSSWNGAFVHAVVHALSTLFQRRPVFSASVANQDPELESIWTLLDSAACGPAGLRAFRFIFVHAVSTLCPRYFWHNVLDLFGELDPRPYKRISGIVLLPSGRHTCRTRLYKRELGVEYVTW